MTLESARSKPRTKREWDKYSQHLADTAALVRQKARTFHSCYSAEWQAVIPLQSMMAYIDDAEWRDDLDRLLVYEKFPELLNGNLCFFIDTMRTAHGVHEVAPLITDNHIEGYKLVAYLCHGEVTLEEELQARAAGQKSPSFLLELDRSANKDFLSRCFLTHVDEASAMAKLVQDRNVWNPETLIALVQGSTKLSALVDGAL